MKYSSDGETWVEQAPYTPPEKEVTEEKVSTKEEVRVVVTEPVQTEEAFPEVQPKPLSEIEKNLAASAFIAPRSVSFSYASPPIPRRIAGRSKERRMSMHMGMLRRRGNVVQGSPQFLRAMKQDMEHETHPGWDSIRRLVGVVG